MDISILIAQAWPDALESEGQAAHWAAVPEDRREAVFNRLRALCLLEADEVGVGKAAAVANLSRQAFHKLRKQWQADRSIQSLTPYRYKAEDRIAHLRDPRPRACAEEDANNQSPLLEARDLISMHPEETNGELGRRLQEARGVEISLPTAVKVIQKTRRLAALEPELLTATFGTSLLLDFVGVRLDGVATEGPMIGAIVLERASGLILAIELGEDHEMAHMQIRAIGQALENISVLCIDIDRARPATCRIILPPHHGLNDSHLQRLGDILDEKRVFAEGIRRFGIRTTSIIGHKIGRLRIFSRILTEENARHFREAPRILGEPTLNSAQFAALAKDEIDRHNAPVIDRLRTLSSHIELCSIGSMAEILRSIKVLLEHRT